MLFLMIRKSSKTKIISLLKRHLKRCKSIEENFSFITFLILTMYESNPEEFKKLDLNYLYFLSAYVYSILMKLEHQLRLGILPKDKLMIIFTFLSYVIEYLTRLDTLLIKNYINYYSKKDRH